MRAGQFVLSDARRCSDNVFYNFTRYCEPRLSSFPCGRCLTTIVLPLGPCTAFVSGLVLNVRIGRGSGNLQHAVYGRLWSTFRTVFEDACFPLIFHGHLPSPGHQYGSPGNS
jgi:hypothetical protein